MNRCGTQLCSFIHPSLNRPHDGRSWPIVGSQTFQRETFSGVAQWSTSAYPLRKYLVKVERERPSRSKSLPPRPQIRSSDREECPTARNSREGAPAALPIPVAPLNSVAASSGHRRAPRPIPPTRTLDPKIDMPPALPKDTGKIPRGALVMRRSKCRERGLMGSTSRQLYRSLS